MNDIMLQVANSVTSSGPHALGLAENFLTLVVLTIILIGFSYRSGRGGIISLIVAFYLGYCIYLTFPYTGLILGFISMPLLKALAGVVLFIASTIIPFIFIQRLVGTGFGVLSFVPRFGLSFLGACFLLALSYHTFGLAHIFTVQGPVQALFAPDQYFFLWFIAPLIGLYLLVH